jgi:hypothetical protein
MATCTSCGTDVTGKKFCPECGTPVQPTNPPTNVAAEPVCPRCNSVNKPGAAFCMNCGSSLSDQNAPAVATAQSQPLTRQCSACGSEVPANLAFCTNCGQSMQAGSAQPATAVAATVYCHNCGKQNAPDVRFCGGCGSPLQTGTPAPTAQTGYAPSGMYAPPSQYGTQYPQQSGPYAQPGQPYQQPYGQQGYQQQSMMGQPPMVLRCPICMAMSPIGTANCPGCNGSLAGVVPTPAMMQQQGQMGGLGGFLQGGSGGNMAMGALGGAAAVVGGEMLLHEIEHEHRGYGYERRDDGLLGDLGGLANDLGLF